MYQFDISYTPDAYNFKGFNNVLVSKGFSLVFTDINQNYLQKPIRYCDTWWLTHPGQVTHVFVSKLDPL